MKRVATATACFAGLALGACQNAEDMASQETPLILEFLLTSPCVSADSRISRFFCISRFSMVLDWRRNYPRF